MVRLLVFLIILAALAFGLVQLADEQGLVTLTWKGVTYGRPLWQAALLALLAIGAVMAVIGFLRAVLNTPENLSLFFRTRRRSKGFNAVTQGMIAVGSGDVRRAQRQAVEAEKILGSEPLALLLKAQAAQLSGDRTAAEAAFRAMLDAPETRPLGLRGLFVEARRRGDAAQARDFAAEAAGLSPSLPWAGTALLEFQSVEKDWSGALSTLSRNADSRLVDRETARRQRAVLLTAQALQLVETDRAAAKAAVLEALKLAPGLVPAAVLAARLYSDNGDIRKATRVLDTAWKIAPHPDLAASYLRVRPGDSARDKLARAQTLAAMAPQSPESAIVLAQAALHARDFAAAREALAPVLANAPTERVFVLMADIEQAENGSNGRVREWLARAVRAPRDPVWTADGYVSDVWQPVSPVTGRIDAFEWKAPVEQLGSPLDHYADEVLADIDEPAQPAALEAPKVVTAEAPPPAPPPPPKPAPEPPPKPEAVVPAPVPVTPSVPPPAAAPLAPEPAKPVAVPPPQPEAAVPPAAAPVPATAEPARPVPRPERRPPPVPPVIVPAPIPDDPGTGPEDEPASRYQVRAD